MEKSKNGLAFLGIGIGIGVILTVFAMVFIIASLTVLYLGSVEIEINIVKDSTEPAPVSTQVEVFANKGWQDTKILVSEGQFLKITYLSGQWSQCEGFGGEACIFVGANGLVFESPHDNVMAAGCKDAKLIARLSNSYPICVGEQFYGKVEQTGYLELRINDDLIGDNGGSVLVSVVINDTLLLPSPPATTTPSDIVSTPSLTSVIINTLTPSPMVTQAFSTPEFTPTVPLTPFFQMSEMDHLSDLLWLECEVSYDLNHYWTIAEECFGFPLPSWQEEDTARFGERFRRDTHIWDDFRIFIDGDVYETDKESGGLYILYKNGYVFTQSVSGDTTYPPNRSLQEVDGKVVWELANPWFPSIIFDGLDLRQESNLEAAYIPYNISDRLIFVAKKDSKYFIVYDGEQIGPIFDRISIGYCCGPAGYSVRRVNEQYWFWGVRDNRYYLGMIGVDE